MSTLTLDELVGQINNTAIFYFVIGNSEKANDLKGKINSRIGNRPHMYLVSLNTLDDLPDTIVNRFNGLSNSDLVLGKTNLILFTWNSLGNCFNAIRKTSDTIDNLDFLSLAMKTEGGVCA